MPPGVPAPDINIIAAKEVDVVEEVLMHRAMYKKSLTALREFNLANRDRNAIRYDQAQLDTLRAITGRPVDEILGKHEPEALDALHKWIGVMK